MKKLLSILTTAALAGNMYAQQDLTMSQQFFSRININPAGIGNIRDIDAFALGRLQWANTDYSPKSGVVNVQTFHSRLNSGLGFSMSYDDIGIAKKNYAPKLVYDYCLKINNQMLFTMGLSAGIQYGYFDPSKYTIDDKTELGSSTFPDTKQTKLKPNFDFGAELVAPKYLVGAAITHLSESKSTTLIANRHYYCYGRYYYEVNPDLTLAPALTWMHKHKTNVVEVNAMAFYKDLWGGVTYHPDVMEKFSSNPLAISAGMEFNSFRVGYSFDVSIGKVADYARTAHELMVSYSFKKKSNSSPNANVDPL